MMGTKLSRSLAICAATALALALAGCDSNASPSGGGGDPGWLSSAGLWNADTQTLAHSSRFINNDVIGHVNANPGTHFVMAKDGERMSTNVTWAPEGVVLGYDTNLTIVSIRAAGTIITFPAGASGSHRLFTVGDGATLTLGNNITLEGRGVIGAITHSAAMIRVEDGGRLNMRYNSMITRHRNTTMTAEYRGATVHIASGGTLDMGGAAQIYNNRQGGVYLSNGSDFVMTDWTGSIQNNHFGTGGFTPGIGNGNVIMLSSHSLHDELSNDPRIGNVRNP